MQHINPTLKVLNDYFKENIGSYLEMEQYILDHLGINAQILLSYVTSGPKFCDDTYLHSDYDIVLQKSYQPTSAARILILRKSEHDVYPLYQKAYDKVCSSVFAYHLEIILDEVYKDKDINTLLRHRNNATIDIVAKKIFIKNKDNPLYVMCSIRRLIINKMFITSNNDYMDFVQKSGSAGICLIRGISNFCIKRKLTSICGKL